MSSRSTSSGSSRTEGYDPAVATDLRPAATASPFATIEEAIEDIRSGRFVVVVDDADRENEGDLTIAAQFVTPESIAFMATHGRGLICLCLTPERCDDLDLRPMTDHNETPLGTDFTSRSRRAKASRPESPRTIARERSRLRSTRLRAARSRAARARLPARAKAGGVLQRAGQTEAAVDLARLAGLIPAGVVCEIMNDDGTMARVPISRRTASATSSRWSRSPTSSSTGAGSRSSSSASFRCASRPSSGSSRRSRIESS